MPWASYCLMHYFDGEILLQIMEDRADPHYFKRVSVREMAGYFTNISYMKLVVCFLAFLVCLYILFF
ncbi:hypothetical protein BFP75_12795 [Maribacter sp. 4G9]|nr:hypothetical protein BFP75_12795 [Maribacter sp. 4G9]